MGRASIRIRPGFAAALTATVLILTACGAGGEGVDDAESSQRPSTSESADQSPAESATPAKAESTDEDGMTLPGTELKYGETATLRIKGQGVVEVTVVRVDRAKPADLGGERIDLAKEEGYYIKSRITVVSHAEDEITTSSVHGDLVGRLTGDERAAPLPSATLKQCQYPLEPRLPEPGDSFQTCNPIVVPKAKPLQGVEYVRTDSPYNMWDGKPLVWRP